MNYTPELRQPAIAGLVGEDLDLGSVPNGAQVSVFYDDMLRDDQVELRWGCSPSPESFTQIRPVESDGKPLSFTVPYEVLVAGLGLDITVDYLAVRADITRQSYPRSVAIRPAASSWPLPRIIDDSGREVAPFNPINTATNQENRATLTVTDARLALKDKIFVEWQLPDGWNVPVSPIEVETPGEVITRIPREALVQSIGKTVAIKYTVKRADISQGDSQALMLEVLPIAPHALPRPTIEEAYQGDVLDLSQFSGDATGSIDPWPFIAIGQKVWFTVEGNGSGNPPGKKINVLSAYPVSDTVNPINAVARIKRELLIEFIPNATITLNVKVSFDGNTDEDKAMSFSTKTLKISNQNTISEDFENVAVGRHEIIRLPNWDIYKVNAQSQPFPISVVELTPNLENSLVAGRAVEFPSTPDEYYIVIASHTRLERVDISLLLQPRTQHFTVQCADFGQPVQPLADLTGQQATAPHWMTRACAYKAGGSFDVALIKIPSGSGTSPVIIDNLQAWQANATDSAITGTRFDGGPILSRL